MQFNTQTIEIRQVSNAEDIDAARSIFREYETWLGFDLCFQGFEKELLSLPGKYAPPYGRLYIAHAREDIAGCAALRKLDEQVCEMKRLFVPEAFRGCGLGHTLVEKLISEARSIGYREMLLDTYPAKMGKAVQLYKQHGFSEIPPYYENPHNGVLFMRLDL